MEISQNDVIDYDSYQMSLDYWKYEITKDEKYIKKYVKQKKKKGRKNWRKPKEGFDGFEKIAEVRKRQQDNVYGMSHMLIPTNLFHEEMPKMIDKYGVNNGRDAITLLLFLHSRTFHGENKNVDKRLKEWAFPGDENIISTLRVSVNRLKTLKEILCNEGLMIYKKRLYQGAETDYYLPLFYKAQDKKNDESILFEI
ncbi:hypothetical protein LLY41_14365 [Cytobacillus firmus]|uniref:hypothetical protein n=1 Tax=Cytobacillus firmus TaxID=1399 RepID=UPI0021857AF9|nr:hypothetical protein [Cytobacillus firmus]URM31602.1 hypothetical protein LLY41_14365 [Cytobacillus firmus]